LPKDESEFWISVDLIPNNHLFARCSYDNSYKGMCIESFVSKKLMDSHNSSYGVYDSNTIMPFLAVKLDNSSSSTQTHLIRIQRSSNFSGTMYFTISMGERLKKGHGVFKFNGIAKNPGNSTLSEAGRDSSVLSLDLSSSTKIPDKAIVTTIDTEGNQSPSQGLVHHMILPNTIEKWFTSKYSNSKSGSYNININDNIEVKQIWSFKYNTKAAAKSTMSNVSISLNWQYDIASTGYHSF